MLLWVLRIWRLRIKETSLAHWISGIIEGSQSKDGQLVYPAGVWWVLLLLVTILEPEQPGG